jgi:hypothetical protein
MHETIAYPVDRIPRFWSWLLDVAAANGIKMPLVIFNEVTSSAGPMADWIKRSHVRDAMILKEPVDGGRVQHVPEHGYAPDLDDEEIGNDPFLIAAALAGPDRTVVTRELSRPSKKRAECKIPDVCAVFGVPLITDFVLYRTLNFTIL